MPDEMSFPPLEVPCDYCGGEGFLKDDESRYGKTCCWCDGERTKLTAFGEAVLDFIKRHVSVKTKIG